MRRPEPSHRGSVRVLVQRLDPVAQLPSYQLEGDAGADLVTTVDVDLAPGERAVLPTGLAMALPEGYAAFIHPRSGLAARVGLSMVNAPGTIDSGYRGEIKVIAINLDPAQAIRLHRGERIAQLVVQRVERAEFAEVAQLPGSQRGAGGHGSTGGARALADAPNASQPRWRGRNRLMARREKRSERSKIDATPPWERRKPTPTAVTTGPFDITDAPDDEIARVDLGALQVPVSELEMRLDVAETQEVVSVTLVSEQGQMQLGAFAAPRSEGIWDDVRAEIKQGLTEQGGRAVDEDGDFGKELVGQLGPDAGRAPVRFIGVNGPRWLLRAMLVGPVAQSEGARADFLETLRRTVVVRGTDPLPVREPIPLRLPLEVAEQIAAGAQESELPPAIPVHAAASAVSQASDYPREHGRQAPALAPPGRVGRQPRRGRTGPGRGRVQGAAVRCAAPGPADRDPGPAAPRRLHPAGKPAHGGGRAVRRHRFDRAGLVGSAPDQGHRARPHGARPGPGWRA